MKIHLVAGDITTFFGDVIVNAANEILLGGGGVDGAIHRAAGPGLRKACEAVYAEPVEAIGPGLRKMFGKRCPVGEVRPTPAFDLPAKWVFHTVGPVWSKNLQTGEYPENELANCYFNSLNIAHYMGLKSIAFPAISCGAYGCPHEECARIARETVGVFHVDAEMDVYFYIHPAKDLGVWEAKFKDLMEISKPNEPTDFGDIEKLLRGE